MEWGILFDLTQDSEIWDGLSMFSTLPAWLLAASNPDRVREVLSKAVPEFAGGQLVLQKCEVDHIRYKNDHWSGFYHLITCFPGVGTPSTTGLEGVIYPPGMVPPGTPLVDADFNSESWQAYLSELNLSLKKKESEKVLVSLAYLTDPEQSRQYLMDSIHSSSPQYQAPDIKASHPKVVRYKPGSRCTIVYRLEYGPNASPDRHWPEQVVAKTYRGVKGKNAYDSMAALWRSPLGSSSALRIAEPLAYDEQERVMIQAAIPEEKTLKSFFQQALVTRTPEIMAELDSVLQKTAAGLAELHRCGVTQGEEWKWEDEMAEIQERIDSLISALPAFTEAAEPLLKRLKQLAAVAPPDPLVPSHGSFRPSQVLIDHDQIGFIDFDSFCQSEPANDLALFLSTLMVNSLTGADADEEEDDGAAAQVDARDKAAKPVEARELRETREARLALATSLHEKFLDAYEQYHAVSRQRVALWESLDLLLLVLHYWIKVKPAALKEIFYLLDQFLQSMEFVRKG